MELVLGFGDNGSQQNSESLNSGLCVFQACSSRAFFVCRGHRWRSMILKTHSREVSLRQMALKSPSYATILKKH